MKKENPTDMEIMEIEKETLSLKKIFIFWYPLAATWLMMAVENPFLTAIIARLDQPKYNLAAFGVAFSFALIIEAPIIMIMSASTKLVTDKDAFYKLRRFTYFLNFLITAVLLVGLVPPIFYYVAETLIGLPPEVSKLTHIASILLIPWPAAIGFRRFYHGILIRDNLTRRVAYTTVVRLITMSGSALALYLMGIPGAYVGAAALSMGVTLEAIAARIMVANSIRNLLEEKPHEKQIERTPLTYKSIFVFYYPLALMSMLSLGVHPIVTFFMGKSRMALDSLAVLPVVNALLFFFRSIGLSFTEVAIALLGEKNQHYIPLRNFAYILGLIALGILGIMAFTPLIKLWYTYVAGLTPALTDFSVLPTQLVVLLPVLTVWINVQRALLVNSKKTGPITWATIIEVGVIIASLQVCITYFDWVGAVAAAFAYTFGRLCANIYLFPHQVRVSGTR
jgi:hypothetical protein